MLFTGCRTWAAAPLSVWSQRAALGATRHAAAAPGPRRLHSARFLATKIDDRVPRHAVMDVSQGSDPEMAALLQYNQTAPRISLAEEARTLIEAGNFGVLSTLSHRASEEGFPAGSVVEYVADAQGRPIFSFSSLSPHTGDVQKDGRCSLTVLAEGFKSMDAARVNLKGVLSPVPHEEREAVKALYLARHPNSYWVEFGDFSWFRMDQVVGARLVGGFGRAGKVSEEEYLAAQPDPVAKFSGPVCGHMNEDHGDSTVAMVKHYVGVTVQKATLLSLDRLGMNALVEKEGHEKLRLRLAFPRPATDRKSIKELIVEMTRAAAGASSS